jgi:hypothetical protein
VAARSVISIPGFGLGWSRVRKVRPVDRLDWPGLHAVTNPRRPLSEARYDVREGNILLLGLLGWGRVNRTRYLQLLWIPVPIGSAGP